MSDYKNYKKLIIGCGINKKTDAWNTDINAKLFPDEVIDITNGLPYQDNSFNKIIADYVFCQIKDFKDFLFSLNECWRVLDGGGVLEMRVPNAEYPVAFRDPADCRYFIPETFDHFNHNHYRYKVFQYGFYPWKILKIDKISGGTTPNIKDRLYVEMTPCKI